MSDYAIPQYGKDIPLEIQLLTEDNLSSAEPFCGDVNDIDFLEYLKEDALMDMESRTYLCINADNGEAIAFISLACSSIMKEKDHSVVEFSPAVLIDKFMVDLRYRHKVYAPEYRDFADETLSSVIFHLMIEKIACIARNVIGAKYGVLFATQDAHHFYEKCGMLDFSPYMKRTDDSRTAQCTPMYCYIEA